MATRLQPVDRWDEAAQKWIVVWVQVPHRAPREPEPKPAVTWNDPGLTSMLGPVL